MSSPFITHVYMLEPNETAARLIDEARPDLTVANAGPDGAPDGQAHALVGFGAGPHINHYPNAKWIHCAGAGHDKLRDAMDFPAPVMTRTIGMLGKQLAEYVLAYYLRRAQKMTTRQALQKEHNWDNGAAAGAYAFTQRALVLGVGPMGATIAQYLNSLGLETIGIARNARQVEGFDRVIAAGDIVAIEPETLDIVVAALPDNPATRGMVDAAFLAHFRDVQLINVGRGSALPEADLFKALEAGHVGEAVLDVQETEPLPASSPLWDHEKITVTPHVSGGTRPEDTASAFLANLVDLEEGKTPRDRIELEK